MNNDPKQPQQVFGSLHPRRIENQRVSCDCLRLRTDVVSRDSKFPGLTQGNVALRIPFMPYEMELGPGPKHGLGNGCV